MCAAPVGDAVYRLHVHRASRSTTRVGQDTIMTRKSLDLFLHVNIVLFVIATPSGSTCHVTARSNLPTHHARSADTCAHILQSGPSIHCRLCQHSLQHAEATQHSHRGPRIAILRGANNLDNDLTQKPGKAWVALSVALKWVS